ncbi:MAG: shikimate dehydrogenase [Lentimicrobium sp.]
MKQKYGLTGFPLGHSFSKKYFTEKFAKESIDAEYDLFPLTDIHSLKQLIKTEPLLRGLNVTIPYKKTVVEYLDSISPEAQAIGAVNTIDIQREGDKILLTGWNTDAPAFESEILDFTGNQQGNALVTGNGGAANAACFVLKKLGWKIRQVVRKPAAELENALLYSHLSKEIMNNTDLIVNATPLGMFPDTHRIPEIPVEFLSSRHFIFDMVYNPEVTRLMEAGSQRGAEIRNGLGMLYKQADLAWDIWQEKV